MGPSLLIITGLIQGLGTGFIFTPMTVLAFATLAPSLRNDGTGVFTLVRNLGGSAGVSIMQAIFTTNVQTVHARLAQWMTPDNPLTRPPYMRPPYSLNSSAGLAALNGEVTRQAAMVSYVDVYHLMFLVTLVLAPMLLFLRPPAQRLKAEVQVEH